MEIVDEVWKSGCEAVLDMVREERVRQVTRYGTNANLEDGTGPDVDWLRPISSAPATAIEKLFRSEYEDWEEDNGGLPTWMHLVREEVGESFQETDPDRLQAELIQVAALCVSWVEVIRARPSGGQS